jgi:hypothetical protein
MNFKEYWNIFEEALERGKLVDLSKFVHMLRTMVNTGKIKEAAKKYVGFTRNPQNQNDLDELLADERSTESENLSDLVIHLSKVYRQIPLNEIYPEHDFEEFKKLIAHANHNPHGAAKDFDVVRKNKPQFYRDLFRYIKLKTTGGSNHTFINSSLPILLNQNPNLKTFSLTTL